MDKKLSDIMYTLQHSIIPENFYDDEIDFISTLDENPGVLFNIFSDLCKQENVENPYTEEDFVIDFYKMDEQDKWLGIKIRFPAPLSTPLCYEMYLFFDVEYEKRGCYTLEYNKVVKKKSAETADIDGKVQRNTVLKQKECATLCSWTKEHVHNNYGSNFLDQGINFYAVAFSIHVHKYEDGLSEHNTST